MFDIRPIQQSDSNAWINLMQQYFDFYKFEVTPEHLVYIFNQALDSSSSLFSLVATDGDKIIGLVNYVISPSTFTKYNCYLSDLYVDSDSRGKKIAERLIMAVQKAASNNGCQSMHWLTAKDNIVAQSLYNKIAHKASWIFYEKSW